MVKQEEHYDSSLPVRECGLKSTTIIPNVIQNMSLPVRECGLKSHLSLLFALAEIVTPCAGVWIEMMLSIATALTLPSLPVRECGLKLFSKR